MGVDVSIFVEYKEENRWHGLGEFFPNRNRDIISELGALGELKGIPEDYSHEFFDRAFIYVAKKEEIEKCIGYKFLTEKMAHEWAETFKAKICHSDRANADWILDPEFENSSWMFFEDFAKILEEYSPMLNCGFDYEAIYQAMKAMEKSSSAYKTRLIFWYC